MRGFLVLIFLMAAVIVEAGDKVENGGFVIVDGEKYILADMHFKPFGGDSFKLDDKIINELESLRDLLGTERFAFSKYKTFHEEQIVSDLVEYRFTNQLPEDCHSQFSVEKGDVIAPIACTKGWVTWIIPKLYSKLSLSHKIGLVVHERMHNWSTQPYEIKIPFIKALVLTHEVSKKRPKDVRLSDEEHSSLKTMLYRARQLDLSQNTFDCHVVHNGGGCIVGPTTNLPSDITVDIGSRIDIDKDFDWTHVGKNLLVQASYVKLEEDSFVEDNVQIISSTVKMFDKNHESNFNVTIKDPISKLKQNAKIENSELSMVKLIGGNSTLNSVNHPSSDVKSYLAVGRNTKIVGGNLNKVNVGNGVELTDSWLSDLQVADETKIVGSRFSGITTREDWVIPNDRSFVVPNDVKIKNCTFFGKIREIGRNFVCEDIKIIQLGNLVFGNDVNLANSEISFFSDYTAIITIGKDVVVSNSTLDLNMILEPKIENVQIDSSIIGFTKGPSAYFPSVEGLSNNSIRSSMFVYTGERDAGKVRFSNSKPIENCSYSWNNSNAKILVGDNCKVENK